MIRPEIFLKPFFILSFLTLCCGYASAQFATDTVFDNPPDDFDTTVSVVEGKPFSHFDTVSYSSLSVVQPSVISDSAVNRIRTDPDYWYAQEVPPRSNTQHQATQKEKDTATMPLWLWYIIAGIFVGAILWYLSLSDIRLFRKKDETIEEEEALSENIFELDYKSAIDKAKSEEDWRMAIRLLYLHALRQLSDYGKIEYKQDKTNSAYLRELKGSELYNSFERITRDFEFTWYGKFPLSAQQFLRVENDFDTLQSSLRA